LLDARGNSAPVESQQISISQAALVPIPIGRRDALVVGEWIGWTKFDLEESSREVEVLSVAVPLGWARQVKSGWQARCIPGTTRSPHAARRLVLGNARRCVRALYA
jgi:hypothetical protein